MTRDDIKRIINEVLGMNDFRTRAYNQHLKSSDERVKEIAEGRARLLNNIEVCDKINDSKSNPLISSVQNWSDFLS